MNATLFLFLVRRARCAFLHNAWKAWPALLALFAAFVPRQAGAQDTVRLVYDARPQEFVTGAVSFVSGEALHNVSGSNRLNTLSGRLPGFSVNQVDGLPGYENSTLSIRGLHTFGPNRSPLILINGRVDDVTMLDPYDIESITILKDAAATAMYGLRSGNGIVLITTKKGTQGKTRVRVNSATSFQQPTRMPEFLDSYNYAMLYNEAMLNDDPAASVRFGEAALEGYRTGANPYIYPDVNWSDEFLRDFSLETRNSLSVEGGGEMARYYAAASYLHGGGLFNVDKDVNTYNTNTAIDVLNAHGNVALDIGRNISLFTDIRAKRDRRNAPGAYNANYDEGIFRTLFATPFNAHPITNADGSIAGTPDYQTNPYGSLNHSGYSIWEQTSLSMFAELEYDLGGLLRGLKARADAGFNNFNQYYINRTKNFAVYQLNPDGESYSKIGLDSDIGNTGRYGNVIRNFDHGISLDYSGVFNKHNLHAILRYDRQQIDEGLSTTLAKNFQGPKAMLSYRFDNRYLVDFAFSYQGSEQYPENDRYGFFPAVSAGWIISSERFMEKAGFVDFLKLRGSYGRTGNHGNTYFGYLGSFASSTGAVFGVSPGSQSGITENRVANPALTWEKITKANAGLDLSLFGARFNASFDYFTEKNRDILIQNAITGMYGADVYVPEGAFDNKGYEFRAGWNNRVKGFSYFVNINYSFAENEIVYQDEEFRNHPWMYRTGHPLNTRFGYVFDRYFTEEDDIASLPDQSLLGTQRPGDLKYKDLNNDGVINDNDISVVGYSKLPEVNYGLNFGFRYKGLDLNAWFQGTERSATYNSGYTYWDFYERAGNVLSHHLNRWRPGSGQEADYPRLTLSNPNNYVSSSYWVQDNSYVRLKYVELGYTFPVRISEKAGMSSARIFINGNNLHSWDKIDHKDPEIQDNGLAYPIQRSFGIGANLQF